MTSKIKVDNINKVSDDSNIINKCGTAINVGASGNTVTVTGNDIRSDSYKAADGGVIASQSGTTITLGASGDTIALASGASQTGFGRTGTVDWQTGSIKTATFTAANGEGYFANTSGGAFTMNLPAGSAGNIVSVADYTNTFASNNLIVSPNGSQKIGGVSENASLKTDGQSVTFVYVDDTEGWKNIQDSTSNVTGQGFMCASVSGACNTLATCGDFKVATFKGPGTFTVNSVSPTPANNEVSYITVAGGGGGAAGSTPGHGAGGGGAGGFRERKSGIDTYTASPLNGATPVTVTAQGYPIAVGGGGPSGPGCANARGTAGTNTTALGITAAGGGGGGGSGAAPFTAGGQGGSGGGGSSEGPSPCGTNPSPTSGGSGGQGNIPSVSPAQGFGGGYGMNGPAPSLTTGGGGGATTVGANGNPSSANGAGGSGATTGINGSSTTFSGGGGGGGTVARTTGANGGPGGGANGVSPNSSGSAATVNTGGGGGGGGGGPPVGSVGTNGGSGIVIIRYKFQ